MPPWWNFFFCPSKVDFKTEWSAIQLIVRVALVVFVVVITVIPPPEAICQECLIGIQVEKHLPRIIDSCIEEQAQSNHEKGHLPFVDSRCGKLGDGHDDTYHIIPTQASAILRTDKEQQSGTEKQSHIEHDDTLSVGLDIPIAVNDEINEEDSFSDLDI